MNFQHLVLPPSFFEWCESSLLGHWIKYSKWDFAILETFHIIGIVVLLGFGMRWQTAAELATEMLPWTRVSLLFMLSTGIPMFMSEAVRLSFSGPFFVKMILLSLALVIHFTIRKKAIRPHAREDSGFGKRSEERRVGKECRL